MTKLFSVKKVSEISKVSIRSLHYYDEIGILKPEKRQENNYRFYSKKDLYKLQQILFYKTLGFSLAEIKEILENENFDLENSLKNQKKLILEKQKNFEEILKTIDKTILKIKTYKMTNADLQELYEGIPQNFRDEAIQKYGEEKVKKAENKILSFSKMQKDELFEKQQKLWKQLFESKNEDPRSEKVQILVKEYFELIEIFWDKKVTKESFIGLGKLFALDERFTEFEGKFHPDFGYFLEESFTYFAENNL